MPLPAPLAKPEHEALALHNAERHDWLEHLGAQHRTISSRGYQRMADLRVSTTDPDATLMETKNGSALGYRTHYVVDGGKARIAPFGSCHAFRGHRQPTDARLAVASTLPVETVAHASHRR